MVDVPRWDSPTVQQAGVPSARVATDAPIEAFGGGSSAAQAAGATQGMLEQVTKLANAEKVKADQVNVLSADNQAADLETKIQVQVAKMRGRDAFGAPDYVADNWKQGVDKISSTLNNDDQRTAFQRTASSRFESLNKNVQMHVAGESRALDENETTASVEASKNLAVLNSFDLDRVEQEKDKQRDQLAKWAQRNGVYTDANGNLSEIFQNKVQQTLSATNRDVIQSQIDNDKIDIAKDYFEKNKSQMTAEDLNHVQKLMEHSEVISQGNEAWDQTKGMTFPDGTPDEAKMEAKIMARDDLSDQRKLQVWDYVKARAGEALGDKRRQEAANERSFMNDVVDARKNGQPLDQALKLADKYATDDYDAQIKTAAIQKTYAPPDVTDPQKYMALYDGTQNSTVKKEDIDSALKSGSLSVKDWEALRKENMRVQLEPVSPAQKVMWETVKENAAASISDKKKQAIYLTAVQQSSQGKTPEEMYKISQDLLKKDPNTQSHFLWINSLPYGGKPQFETDTEKSNASNLGMGMVYQDVGKQETAAIAQGIQLKSGKAKVELGDIDSFAQQLGGYDAIKSGTPANNAIQSLVARGKPVTPANVKAVLEKHQDGKW